jgi:O-Antigen ligase
MTTFDAGTPVDIVSAVREAAASVPRRQRRDDFSLSAASAVERVIAPLLGLYLGYAVVRLPEVFEAIDVPHLPMILMLVFLAMLAVAIPSTAWEIIWEKSKAMRLVVFLLLLAIGTAELGIWPSESIYFVRTRYVICVAVFLSCLVFLRDRKTMRTAVAIYVLCVTAVSYNVVHTYDPNAVVLDEDGVPVPPEVLAERPELRRLQIVGDGLDSNDFGAILAITFPLAIWLSIGNLRRRLFWSGAAVLMVMAVVPTQSRGSELGFIAAAVVLLGAGSRGWRRWLSGALLAGCVGLFVIMATGIGAAGRFTDFSSNDYNLTDEGRWFFWKQGFVWMLKRPWGYGIDNYTTYFGMLNGNERAAHSTWVQYGMELGVAGLVLFVALCWWLVKNLRAHRKWAVALTGRVTGAREEANLAGHMLAVMAAALVTGSFLSNAYYPIMYMALGLSAAVILGSPLPDRAAVEAAAQPKAPAAPPGGVPRRRLRQFPGKVPAN